MEALRRPAEFVAVWQLAAAEGAPPLLYVSAAPHALVGSFFESENQPGVDMGQADMGWLAAIQDWRTEDEFEDYLRAAGYCLQLYPVRRHLEAHCRLLHEHGVAEARASRNRGQARDCRS